jgi:hypothetical protein
MPSLTHVLLVFAPALCRVQRWREGRVRASPTVVRLGLAVARPAATTAPDPGPPMPPHEQPVVATIEASPDMVDYCFGE